jgi:three-Cys-motif partner protein
MLVLAKQLPMNQFGGNWTDNKMDIVVSYAKAYLTIMQAQSWVKTIYFDGFAGSGSIVEEKDLEEREPNELFELSAVEPKSDEEVKKGTALRILDIIEPKPFDLYYFVEKNEVYQQELKSQVEANFPGRSIHVVKGDCNEKMVAMADYMKKNTAYRALAFIDPYGMSVKWSSIEALKGLGIDLWILVPTGVGANRVLVNDGEIPESWLCTLESFLGISRDMIVSKFYKQTIMRTFFEEEVTLITIERDTVNKVAKLYSDRLKEVFKFVSEPYVMRNSMNSIMYHFMMATNNKAALKIANDVIKPKYQL